MAGQDPGEMTDPYDLRRFVDAQASVIEDVYGELRAGRKRSHWIWFIFPQVAGLGDSQMSKRFAIVSLPEARAYLEHPILGPRLRKCTQLILDIESRSIEMILGHPDYLKFRSSMTLFSSAAADRGLFEAALRKYFDGKPDPLTLAKL